MLTFGFEVSLDILRQRQSCLNPGATLLVPLSEVNEEGLALSMEQDYCMLTYKGAD